MKLYEWLHLWSRPRSHEAKGMTANLVRWGGLMCFTSKLWIRNAKYRKLPHLKMYHSQKSGCSCWVYETYGMSFWLISHHVMMEVIKRWWCRSIWLVPNSCFSVLFCDACKPKSNCGLRNKERNISRYTLWNTDCHPSFYKYFAFWFNGVEWVGLLVVGVINQHTFCP